jgi:hypothetical protein
MLTHTFTRFNTQFRDGAMIHAKFVVSAGPLFAFKATRSGSSYNGLSLVKNGGTGLLKLTLLGGAREIAVVSARHINVSAPTDFTKALGLTVLSVSEGTGIITLASFNAGVTTASPAAADAITTDEVHFTLYVAK